MNSEQLGIVPTINFNGSPLTLSGLSKILTMLNESGDIRIQGISPGSVNLLELGAALSTLHRPAFALAGATARQRVNNEVSLWITRSGRQFYRTMYRHKLLRCQLAIDHPSSDYAG